MSSPVFAIAIPPTAAAFVTGMGRSGSVSVPSVRGLFVVLVDIVVVVVCICQLLLVVVDPLDLGVVVAASSS